MSPFEIGRPAVFAFFVLSGYWVLRMYDEKYRTTAGIGTFYLSRLLRIWLPFACAYVLVMCAYGVWDTPRAPAFWTGLGMLGIASSGYDVLGTSWSLDIEMQFYLLVPVIWWILMQRPAQTVLLGAVAGLCVLGWWLQLSFGIWTVLSYLPAFMAGALIWRLSYQPSRLMVGAGVLVFCGIAVAVWITPQTHALLRRDLISPFHEDWFGMVWVACLIPLIAWNVRQPSSRLDMHLGNYSYALYITHWPVIAFIRPLLTPLSLAERGMILGAIVLISVLFYGLVDRRAEHIRRVILRRRMAQPVSIQG